MGSTKKNDALRSVVKLRIAAGVRAGVKRHQRRQRESDAAAVSTSSCAALPIAKRAKHMHTYIDIPHTITPAAWNAYPDRVTRLRLATFTRAAAVQPTDVRPTTHPTIPTIMYGGASIDWSIEQRQSWSSVFADPLWWQNRPWSHLHGSQRRTAAHTPVALAQDMQVGILYAHAARHMRALLEICRLSVRRVTVY